MKYIGYIFLGISGFIIGFALYLVSTEKSKEKARVHDSLQKARAAKAAKAAERSAEPNNEELLEDFKTEISRNGTKETEK